MPRRRTAHPSTLPLRRPRPIDAVTIDERARMLERVSVWRPIDTASADLLSGPPATNGFPFDADVACAFHYPEKPLTGVTPKFECEVVPGDAVKVNSAATTARCLPKSRRRDSSGAWLLRRPHVPGAGDLPELSTGSAPRERGRVASRKARHGANDAVRSAAIERKIEGDAIEAPDYEGWSWKELDAVAERLNPAVRAQVDALKLLAVFVQHVDSKPEQQALVCADGKTAKDRSGNATCREPLLVVKDLGSTFGAGSKFNFEKMKLASWRSVPIWKDVPGCQGHLTRSLIGTLEHPIISEAGRRFLAERLLLLSDRQLRDLFTAARVEQRQDTIDGRQATVDDWVRVFKAKRDEIRNRRCDGVAYTSVP